MAIDPAAARIPDGHAADLRPAEVPAVEVPVAAPPPVPELLPHLRELNSQAGRPLHEQADFYRGLHSQLQSALAEIDGDY